MNALILALSVMQLVAGASGASTRPTQPQLGQTPAPLRPPYWATWDDVPAAIFADGRQGITGIRLSIDPKGHPFRCDVVSTSGTPGLDEVTCLAALQRGRFRPARDKQGNPTFGSYSSYAKWVNPNNWAKPAQDYDRVDMVLPVNRLPPEGTDGVVLRQMVGADGLPSSCHGDDAKQDAALTRVACRYLSTMKMTGMQNEAGVAVAAVYRWTIKFTVQVPGFRPPLGASFPVFPR